MSPDEGAEGTGEHRADEGAEVTSTHGAPEGAGSNPTDDAGERADDTSTQGAGKGAPAPDDKRVGRLRRSLARLRRASFTRASRGQGTVGAMTAATATSTDLDPALRDRIRAAVGDRGEREVLIGLDVDGTLVDHHGMMTGRMHRTLQRAAEKHHVVIATGRSIGATLPIVRAAGVTRGYAVCSNGGVTLQIDAEARDGFRVVDVQSFQPGEALAALREVAPRAGFALEAPDGLFFSTGEFQDNSFGVRATPTPFDELTQMEAVRVVVHDPVLSAEEFSEIVRSAGVHGVEYAIGTTAWLDMAAPGVSKATALEAIRERLDIPEGDTVTVGDGFNDVEMLRWAGVGFAMGQALDGVAEAADLRTGTVWQDGTAEVLEALSA